MPNSFELDGRGPSDRQLLATGTAVVVVTALLTIAMLLKSTGRLNDYVRVVADLVNVGDGLPQKSDVKYHGVLVGMVDDVVPASNGKPNYVHIDLKEEFAKSVPASVTARVVPSNVFAVSSVQLVGTRNQESPGSTIRAGAHIPEDTRLPTVLFQTTVSKLRDLLAAAGRGRDDRSVGILAALGAATDHRRGALLTAGGQLNRLLDQLNSIVSTDSGPSTVSALVDAAHGLAQTAPDLLDALHQAVEPMQTFAETRGQLASLLSGAENTVGTTRESFGNHIDQLIRITGDFTPVLGILAMKSNNFVPAVAKLDNLANRFMEEVWVPGRDVGNMRAMLTFTPSSSYTRADCPHYGELKGHSCFTAPLIPVRPDLPEVLLPQNYQPPIDLAPPPGTVIGPDGNLVAVGPPLINPSPNLTDPNPPLPDWLPPSPPVPGSANPNNPAPGAPAPASPPPDAPWVAPVAPKAPWIPQSSFGGNVGPIGSQYERNMLSVITGQPATSATELLLGPVARGTTVSLKQGLKPPPGGPN
ncbi:MlaD family protein [Mycobacterium montefiorense]|uniref:Mammalian cell entry protein n=1 Tax=Mycobacterium montefiorense TaxID=154654 RepID=A0AA37PP98_9MYCO|nr:MCE family protein [Mycobacterium montefiorense]GBG37584.1 mammalian cell entry protein [Mycobacterium montefiorense]GKU36255.1 mammalian cell entry protein [Mycobacterium montefiorense]GKU41243.1 mammalian cell entry protein [Mycobacterium montefiorense]GKU47773.1 mammalian cell entry protein [Mycobacterium montefiorense]GKU52764.1 mammalian cell entry protein [Mycobacterium montefiorense]